MDDLKARLNRNEEDTRELRKDLRELTQAVHKLTLNVAVQAEKTSSLAASVTGLASKVSDLVDCSRIPGQNSATAQTAASVAGGGGVVGLWELARHFLIQ